MRLSDNTAIALAITVLDIFRRSKGGATAAGSLLPLPSEVFFYVRSRSTASRYPFPPSVDEQRYLHVARLDPYDPNAAEPRAVLQRDLRKVRGVPRAVITPP